MKPLLLILSIVGYFSFYSRQAGVGPYRAPFVTCCTVVLLLYVTALVGQLSLGLWLTALTGCGLVLLELYGWPRRSSREVTIQNIVLFGLLVLPFVWLYLAINSHFKFLLWDEFSFWASSTKIIFETNALFKADSPIFLKSYPPGQQLFQYYIVKLTGWSEKNVLFAQNIWMLSGLLCIAGTIVKRPLDVATTFLLSCIVVYLFEYSFSSIYSDALLAISFGACVALAINTARTVWASAAFAMSVVVLILIKEIALLLMLIAWALYLALLIFDRYKAAASRQRSVVSIAMVAGLSLAPVLIVQRSWAWYVATIDGTRQESVGLAEKLSIALSSGRIEKTWTEFLSRVATPGYLKVSFDQYLAGPAVWVVALLLLILVFVILWRQPTVQRGRQAITFFILFGGAIAYTGVLFFSYLVFFTEYEGIRLASFERYLSTYVLALSLIVFSFYMATFDVSRSSMRILNLCLIATLILLCAPKSFYTEMMQIQSLGPAVTLRRDTEAFAGQVKRHIKAGQKVYFVAQNSNGLERTMFYYAMLPYTTSTGWCWSFGQKYYEGDVWTCDKNILELVQGYDYLALYHADSQFWSLAGDLFEASARGISHGVFRINRGGTGANVFTELK